MKLSKKEILLICYLVFKAAAMVAQTLNPDLKDTFNNAVGNFIDVLNEENDLL